MNTSPGLLDRSLAYLASEQVSAVDRLLEIVSIPSISNEPGHDDGIQAAARWFCDQLKLAGIPTMQLVNVPRSSGGHHNPLLVGEYRGAGASKPTVLIYFHYDVQAGGDGWMFTRPFEPKIVDNVIFGRGVGDNKGPAIAILQALRAMINSGAGCPVNFVILAEGEEEAGGDAIELFVRDPKKYGDFGTLFDGLTCALVADVEMADETRPGLEFGLRGLVYYKLHISGPAVTCHSGLKGGAIQDPAEALAKMLAAVRDHRTGEIVVPGFMDGATPLSEAERQMLAAYPVDSDPCGAPALMQFPGRSLAEQLGAMPTFTVHGLCSGHVSGAAIAPGTPTKIFPDAWALCSNRLIGGQDPDSVVESLRRFFESFARDPLQGTVTVEMEVLKASKAMRFDPSCKEIRLAADAMAAVWKTKPALGMGGGSIPIVQAFVENLKIPAVLWGGTDVNCGMHGPDERLSLINFHNSSEAMVRYFHLLAGE